MINALFNLPSLSFWGHAASRFSLSHRQDFSGSLCIVLPLFPTYWEKNSTLSEFFGPESKFPGERLQMIHLKRWLATHNPSRMGQLHRRTKDWGGRWVWVSGEIGCWRGLRKKWNTRERQNSTLFLDLSSRKTALEIYQVKLSFQKNTKC